jgi:hypothetical protein
MTDTASLVSRLRDVYCAPKSNAWPPLKHEPFSLAREAADLIEAQAAEIARLRAYAREASRDLGFHAGGGSEMFKTVAGEPYADPGACRAAIMRRQETRDKLRNRKLGALKDTQP